MAKSAYIGVSNVAKKIKKFYIGSGGTAHAVKKAYVGVGGVAKLWWSGSRNYGVSAYKTGDRTTIQIASDNITSFSSYTHNLHYNYLEITYFANKYFTYGMSTSVSNSNGIYYKTSLSGTWTLALNTYQKNDYVLVKKNGYLYAIIADQYIAYMRSSNGTSWTFPSYTGSYNYNKQWNCKAGSVAMYNGRMYFTGCISNNGVYYAPMSSMSSTNGRFAATVLYKFDTTYQTMSQMAIDTNTGIGYVPYTTNYSDSDVGGYRSYPSILKINLSTGTSAAQSISATGSFCNYTRYNHIHICAIIVDGKIYIEGGGVRIYANAVSDINTQLAWVGTIPTTSTYNEINGVALYYLGDKIVKLYSDGSVRWTTGTFGTRYIYYRINNTLTATKDFGSASSDWPTVVLPFTMDDAELFDYDVS